MMFYSVKKEKLHFLAVEAHEIEFKPWYKKPNLKIKTTPDREISNTYQEFIFMMMPSIFDLHL